MNLLLYTSYRKLISFIAVVLTVLMASQISLSQNYVWDDPEGQACFESWMTEFTTTLNQHNGNANFNQLKPWSFTQYGHKRNNTLTDFKKPDDWDGYYESNKYKFLWAPWNNEDLGATYKIAGESFFGLQLRYYVRNCLSAKGIFLGSDWLVSGNTSTSSNSTSYTNSLTNFDSNATCPSNFSMHIGSTLTMICYCSPDSFTYRVWGTGTYTSDSNICLAAQHTGAVSSAGGMVVLKGAAGQPNYQGSTQNGIVSGKYANYHWSFFFPQFSSSTGSLPPTSNPATSNPPVTTLTPSTTQTGTSGSNTSTSGSSTTTTSGTSTSSSANTTSGNPPQTSTTPSTTQSCQYGGRLSGIADDGIRHSAYFDGYGEINSLPINNTSSVRFTLNAQAWPDVPVLHVKEGSWTLDCFEADIDPNLTSQPRNSSQVCQQGGRLSGIGGDGIRYGADFDGYGAIDTVPYTYNNTPFLHFTLNNQAWPFPEWGVSEASWNLECFETGNPTDITSPPIFSGVNSSSGTPSLITDWTVNLGTIRIIDNKHIETSPPSEGDTSMYIAPSNWHGNWQNYSFLSFEKKSWGGSYYSPGEGDVVLSNDTFTARYIIPEHHDGEWHSYTVPLYDDGNWVYEGGATDLSQILQNVTGFQIRAEYGDGTDHSALANVLRHSNQGISSTTLTTTNTTQQCNTSRWVGLWNSTNGAVELVALGNTLNGYYGDLSNPTKTLSGEIISHQGDCILLGSWGRTNGISSGGFVFVLDSPSSFEGGWSGDMITLENYSEYSGWVGSR